MEVNVPTGRSIFHAWDVHKSVFRDILSMVDVPEPNAEPADIPDKLYFRIGEVSDLVGVEPYVLRYWETEFPAVGPKKSDTGHRMYRRREVELLLKIKHLLYEKKYTIEGARQFLNSEPKGKRKRPVKSQQAELFAGDALPEIRKELAAILALLK
ncbi:MAG TPA: MerR family transcriptional regulator [Bryobacteraceae bacterium]|nr:MerR family transcriptional regulator [Bryobacteraceae bacterium]